MFDQPSVETAQIRARELPGRSVMGAAKQRFRSRHGIHLTSSELSCMCRRETASDVIAVAHPSGCKAVCPIRKVAC